MFRKFCVVFMLFNNVVYSSASNQGPIENLRETVQAGFNQQRADGEKLAIVIEKPDSMDIRDFLGFVASKRAELSGLGVSKILVVDEEEKKGILVPVNSPEQAEAVTRLLLGQE